MAKLKREQRAFQQKFYAPNSITTRDTQIRKYLNFIDEFGGTYAPFPCPSEQVALYATWLARSMKYTSIINYLSGLNYYLRLNNSPSINYKEFVLHSTLTGIRRVKGDAPRQAVPILPAMLRRMFSHLYDTAGHTAWRAAVLCSFRALLRKSQVTLSDSVLSRGDFQFFGWGMLITIRRTKTIQFQQRVLRIPVASCNDTQLCAVYWTKRHFHELPAKPQDPAFRLPALGVGSTPLTYRIYQDTLKCFAEEAGLDPLLVSSHSLRRGGCTYLAMCGASLEELRVRGDWSSEAIFAYLQTPLTMRIASDIRVSSLLADQLPEGDGLGDT